MTPDQHLHAIVWDLLVRIAQLAAEIDALKAQLGTPNEDA